MGPWTLTSHVQRNNSMVQRNNSMLTSAATTVASPHQTEVPWYIHIFRVVTPLSIAFSAISIVLRGPCVKIRLDDGSLKFGKCSARPEGRLGHRDDPVHVPTPNSSTAAPP